MIGLLFSIMVLLLLARCVLWTTCSFYFEIVELKAVRPRQLDYG